MLAAALLAVSLAMGASPADAAPAAKAPSTMVVVPRTVIFVHGPVTIWYEVFADRTVLLCKETDSGNPHLGTALTCNLYKLPSDAGRLSIDLRSWIMAALRT